MVITIHFSNISFDILIHVHETVKILILSNNLSLFILLIKLHWGIKIILSINQTYVIICDLKWPKLKWDIKTSLHALNFPKKTILQNASNHGLAFISHFLSPFYSSLHHTLPCPDAFSLCLNHGSNNSNNNHEHSFIKYILLSGRTWHIWSHLVSWIIVNHFSTFRQMSHSLPHKKQCWDLNSTLQLGKLIHRHIAFGIRELRYWVIMPGVHWCKFHSPILPSSNHHPVRHSWKVASQSSKMFD